MHFEVLNKDQQELLPYLTNFKRSFYLVGGNAIAMHLGHRRSIDYDLFTPSRLGKYSIKIKLNKIPFKQVPIFEDTDQLHLILNNVKLTFFNFPYSINHTVKIESYITMPDLLTLSAMKAFALGRRSKWKDYVDLFYILKDHFSIKEISEEALKIFPNQFSEKLFREQLTFHKDIDKTEPVEFLSPEIPETQIKEFLIDKAIDLEF